MPIPQPNPGEHEEQFVQRCMADSKMADEYPDESQRYAVCIAQIWNKVLYDREKQRESFILNGLLELIKEEQEKYK